MNFVALSLVSLKGIMVLGSWIDQEPRILFLDEWTSADNTGLSSDVIAAWERLQNQAGKSFSRSSIQEIFVISGPGSFTGIRVGASFAVGLAAALEVSAYGISSYDLFEAPVGIPIRTHLAMNTPSLECASANIEFLFQRPDGSSECRLPKEGDLLVGVQDAQDSLKHWPTKEQLARALKSKASKRQELVPDYGISPKIFGQRT